MLDFPPFDAFGDDNNTNGFICQPGVRRLQDAAYCAGLDDRPVGLGSTGRDGASNTIRCCPGLRKVDIVSEIRQGGRVRHKLVRSHSEH